jgi:hypothetical protein
MHIIIEDIDLFISKGVDLNGLSIDESCCFQTPIPIWYWPFVSCLLKKLMDCPAKRISPLKELISSDDDDPFPDLKHADTQVSRLRSTVNRLSCVISDFEIRSLVHHPSSSSTNVYQSGWAVPREYYFGA